MKTLQIPDYVGHSRKAYGYFDDLEWLVTAHRWTSLVADAGSSLTVTATRGGRVALVTGAVLNNEASLFATNEIFLFADDAPLEFEACVQFTEAATNAANVCAGFSSEFAANLLQDTVGTPAANQSAALIYKITGETVWRFVTSMGTTQTISTSTTTAGGAAFQYLRVECNAISSTQIECVPKVNGTQLMQSSGGVLVPIKHIITLSSPAQMGVGVYVKSGASSETLVTDFISAWQKR